MQIIKDFIYKLLHPQPSFRNPETWGKWFLDSSMRDIKQEAKKINKAREKYSRRS